MARPISNRILAHEKKEQKYIMKSNFRTIVEFYDNNQAVSVYLRGIIETSSLACIHNPQSTIVDVTNGTHL